MAQSKERIGYADLYRGMGIILMIMAHIGFGAPFNHYIHAFHMPVFFFASGYFFTAKKANTFFLSKARSLLLPYLFYTVAVYAVWRIFFQKPDESLLTVLVYMNSSSFIAAALWFLPALFLANVIYRLVRTAVKQPIAVTVIVAILALSGSLLRTFYTGRTPFAFDAALVGTGLMHIGYICNHGENKFIKRAMNLKGWDALVAFVLFSALIMLNGEINMREGHYGFVPLFWCNAAGMCVTLWNIARMIAHRGNNTRLWGFGRRIVNGISHIGNRSMAFLCLNQVTIALFFILFPADSLHGASVLVHNIACLVLVIIFLYPLAFLREKYSPFAH